MNNHRSIPGHLLARPTAAALPLLLVLAMAQVQAQGLRPTGPLRAPAPAASQNSATSTSGQQQADFIVAVVNSEPITNSEVRLKLLRTEQQILQQGGRVPPRSELVPQMLERMIVDKVQLQTARTSNVRIDSNSVDGAIQSIARQNDITVEELKRRLKADGIAFSKFESEIRDELLVSRLRQREVEGKVVVSEQDVDQYLRDQEKGANTSVVALNLAHILVAVPENASPDQVAALQARARQVAERARSGGDFIALAAEFSDSPNRSNGGQIGLRPVDRYPPLFVDATKAVRSGGVAGPVRSDAGFHILKVIEKRQAGIMPDAVVTQTHARHILLRPTTRQPEAAVIEKLAEFKKRILAGQSDFAALARENSEDGSAKEGGDLGWANPGIFVPEFEQVLSGLAPNQISDPFVSRFGVHLVQVLERRETTLSAKDLRELARNAVRQKKQEEAYRLWVQELRGRAYVEYRDPPQ